MARAWDARRTILVMHDAHLTALSLPAGAHLRRSVWPAAGLCVAAHLPKGSLQALLPAQSTRPQTRSPRPQACVAATYAIKPLSLHERLHEPPPTAERPVMSSLRCVRGRGRLSSGPKRAGALWDTTAFLVGQSLRSPSLRRRISGTFTLGEIHSWVSACLPGVPARLQGERGEFAFRNLLVGTLLLCDYGPGEPAVMAGSEGAAPPSRLPVSRGRRLCLRLAHDPRHCQGGARQGSDCA